MKRLLLIIGLFLGPLSYAQNIIDQAAKEPIRNQNGDPTNNIIDPNGSKQGNWFYLDTHGKEVVKEIYKNNERKETYVSFDNQWVNATHLQTNNTVKTALKSKEVELKPYQQILITIKDNSFQIYGLGKWDKEDFKKHTKVLESYLEQNVSGISQPTYIIL